MLVYNLLLKFPFKVLVNHKYYPFPLFLKNNSVTMKKFTWLIISTIVFISCQKENSMENGSNTNPSIIGLDCRTGKIVFADSSTDIALGSLAAVINDSDQVTSITRFDSLSFTIDFNALPVIASDTVFINNNEYYIVDAVSALARKFHGLYDPTNIFSPQFDIAFSYNADGNLVKKSYSFSANPGTPYQEVNYTYSGGNLVQMTETDLTTGNKITDAELSFYPLISPKNYLYIFPDEYDYASYSQFYNFGTRSKNAVKTLKVRFYAPGNILSDSAVSNFIDYKTSIDNYVLSVVMTGDDQPSIPAQSSRLKFSYKCK